MYRYRITRALSVGQFVTSERGADLLAAGITHVLNVSTGTNQVMSGDGGFREVAWFPLEDYRHITEAELIPILDALHQMASEPDAHVYVHCVAGHLRSPAVLWLYLVACGVDPDAARDVIRERSPTAAPGDRKLVGPALVRAAQKHGRANYLPHPRADVLVPADRPVAGEG